MSFYSQEEQELIHHTFTCFKMSLTYLIKEGYGIVISKEDLDNLEDEKQYLVCNLNGDLKIIDLCSDSIEDGTMMKIKDETLNVH